LVKVLYTGDSEVCVSLLLPGAEVIPMLERIHDGSKYLRQALESDPEINVVYMTPQVAYSDFPKTAEDLDRYDVIVLSDVGHDTLALYPAEQLYKGGTNRLKEIKKYVENGGALAFCGGWFGFQGRFGHGRWYGTPIAEILPVEILPVSDDRVETPEGVKPEIINAKHPITNGIPWNNCPTFLGYNKVGKIREGAELLGKIEGDPFIAAWEYRYGRVMVFTSDPAPHWGINFLKWKYYSKFWVQTINWLSKAF
jgi:uncharacterized membrane protein